MKKSEEIKRLKHELGRAQKKVGDQSKEIIELKKNAKFDRELINGISRASDIVFAQMCMSFGLDVKDDDGNHIGYRLEMPKPTDEPLEKYTMRTELKDDGVFTIGLVLKEEQE